MAYTVTFPSAGPCPDPDDVADWLTEQGEPFDREGPHTLQLRALPVRMVVVPEEQGFQAHIEVTRRVPLHRMVDLLFNLSVRAGADVRLAGAGEQSRASLWLRLADEQDRRRLARAIALADEQGKKEEVVRGLWAVLGAAAPRKDVRWDASRERVVELKEVGAGITVEEAAWHLEDPQPGDVVGVRVTRPLHLVGYRWLSEAHPGLTGL